MKTIHHVVEIAVPREEVYAALADPSGLAAWWTTRVTADPSASTIDFTFEDEFNPRMRAELTAPDAVRWECVAGAADWAGDRFTFELATTNTGTCLRFWQQYSRELPDDAYGTYNFNWAYYLESLRLLCQTGTGKPFQVK